MSDTPYNSVWPQMSGYVLARVETQAEKDVTIMLQAPAGKTQYRIRLQGANSMEMPTDLPDAGIRIIKVEMGELFGGDEFIAMELANGEMLKGMCKQIVVDVF